MSPGTSAVSTQAPARKIPAALAGMLLVTLALAPEARAVQENYSTSDQIDLSFLHSRVDPRIPTDIPADNPLSGYVSSLKALEIETDAGCQSQAEGTGRALFASEASQQAEKLTADLGQKIKFNSAEIRLTADDLRKQDIARANGAPGKLQAALESANYSLMLTQGKVDRNQATREELKRQKALVKRAREANDAGVQGLPNAAYYQKLANQHHARAATDLKYLASLTRRVDFDAARSRGCYATAAQGTQMKVASEGGAAETGAAPQTGSSEAETASSSSTSGPNRSGSRSPAAK